MLLSLGPALSCVGKQLIQRNARSVTKRAHMAFLSTLQDAPFYFPTQALSSAPTWCPQEILRTVKRELRGGMPSRSPVELSFEVYIIGHFETRVSGALHFIPISLNRRLL